MDAQTGIGMIEIGLLAGIFYRMGGFRAALEALKDRVHKLETEKKECKNA